MTKKLDLEKTQFLFESNGLTTTQRRFRRRKTLVLFRPDGPFRVVTYADWQKLRSDYPEEVKQDGLYTKTVWVLQEIKA